MRKKIKALKLNRETLRVLDEDSHEAAEVLREAKGASLDSCVSVCNFCMSWERTCFC